MSLSSPSQTKLDGSSLRIAIVAARYNETLVDALVENASKHLQDSGCEVPVIQRVPGSAELPFAASIIAKSGAFDAIIAIGIVIAGDTNHHNVIGDSTARTLQQLSIDSSLPIINGIVVVENQQQAEARAGQEINRGKEFAEAALEMEAYTRQWKTKKNP